MLFSPIGNLDAVNWIVDNSLGMTIFFLNTIIVTKGNVTPFTSNSATCSETEKCVFTEIENPNDTRVIVLCFKKTVTP